MRHVIWLSVVILSMTYSSGCAAEAEAKQFLRYLYGEEGIDFAKIAQPSADSWMLRGPKNEMALAAVTQLKLKAKASGLVSGVVGTDLYFVETRDGLVDPAINLSGIYQLHHNLALQFVYFALSRDENALPRLVTDFDKLVIEGTKPPRAEMAQYGQIIEQLPVARSSKPVDDEKSHSVEYRIPMGQEFLFLRMIKVGAAWKIDTSKKLTVRLSFLEE